MKGLSQSFLWIASGSVALAASQWLALAALAQLAGPEEVGYWALALAICAPVMMLFNLQLRGVLATDARRQFAFRDYWRLRWRTSLLALSTILVVSFVGGYQEAVAVIFLIGLTKFIESFSDVCYGYFQRCDALPWQGRSLLARAVSGAAFALTAVWIFRTAVAAAAGLTLGWLLPLLFFDRRRAYQLAGTTGEATAQPKTMRSGYPRMWKLVQLSLPLGVVGLLVSLGTNIPRYFVEIYQGPAALGVFAALAYAEIPGVLIVTNLGQTVMPRMADHIVAGRFFSLFRLLGGAAGIATLLGVAAVGVAAWFGGPLLELAYGPAFAERADLLVWLMAAAGVGYVASIFGYALTAARSFWVQVPLFVALTALLIAGCYAWTPTEGVIGAAKALLLTRCCQLVGTTVAFALSVHRSSRRIAAAVATAAT